MINLCRRCFLRCFPPPRSMRGCLELQLRRGRHPPSPAARASPPLDRTRDAPVHSVPQTQLETHLRGSHPKFGRRDQALFEGAGQRLCNFPIWYLRKLPPPAGVAL